VKKVKPPSIVLIMRPAAATSHVRLIGMFATRNEAFTWLEAHPRTWSGFCGAEAHRIEPPAKYE